MTSLHKYSKLPKCSKLIDKNTLHTRTHVSSFLCSIAKPVLRLLRHSSHVSSTTTPQQKRRFAMILRILCLAIVTFVIRNVQAEVVPEVTTLAEGYNVVAKLPCIGCPFLYQDSASGQDEGWKVREDENALVSR